ncbi:hypothetical protein [Marinobacter sp. ANT_B65]|nr:hypothetical protein [Marinobacter sp. ANT_B65]
MATVWVPVLADLSGYAWIIGAALGGFIYYVRTKNYEAILIQPGSL